MKYYYITFRSVTHAQKAERLLAAEGIRGSLQRTPRWMEEQGCGYCLKFRTPQIGESVAVLRARRIPMRKVYVQNGDGQLEEVSV